VDELIWVLPRTLPHKDFAGAPFEARRAMIETLARLDPRFSAVVSQGGLYVDIAREAREHFGEDTEIALVLGRDAAERIATWDYGMPGVFDDLVGLHRLLVAARRGEYEPAPRHRNRITRLPMDATWDDVSSSEIRRRIGTGENWYDLVHPDLAEVIKSLYPESHAGSRENSGHK